MPDKYEPVPLPAGVPRSQLPWEQDGLIHLPFLMGAEPLPEQEGEPELLEGHAVVDSTMDLFLTGLDVDVDKVAPWAIGPVIAPNDCCYIVGLENTGKTSLVVDILWGVLAGPEFDVEGSGRCLGGAWKINREFVPHGSKVMFLNAETTSAAAFYRKLHQRSEHAGLATDSEAHRSILSRALFGDVEEFGFAPKTEWKKLAEIIKAVGGIKVLVIDPVFNFFDPVDNGDATWVTRSFKPFVRELKKAGIITFCLAHPNSNAITRQALIAQKLSPFGTSQQKGVIDCSFGVTVNQNKNAQCDLVLTKSRTRDTQSWIPRYKSQITLQYSQAACGYAGFKYSKESRWEYTNPMTVVALNTQTRKFLAACPPGQSFTRKALDDSGLGDRAIRREIPLLLQKQLITEDVIPGEAGKPKLWTFTDEGLKAWNRARQDWPDEVEDAVNARREAGYDDMAVDFLPEEDED